MVKRPQISFFACVVDFFVRLLSMASTNNGNNIEFISEDALSLDIRTQTAIQEASPGVVVGVKNN
jgi:hypothetical protein